MAFFPSSVLCCGYGMFIPDPDFCPGSRIPDLGFRISDPKITTKERGEKKKNLLSYLFL
jgi:hypothetical protein